MSTEPNKYGFDPIALAPTPPAGPAPTPAVPVAPPPPRTLLLPPAPKDNPAAATAPVPAPSAAEPPKSPTPPPAPGRADWVAEVFKLMATPTRQKGVIAAGLLSLAAGAGAAKYFWPKATPAATDERTEVARAAAPDPAPLPAPPVPDNTPDTAPPISPPVLNFNLPPIPLGGGGPAIKEERAAAKPSDAGGFSMELPQPTIPTPAPPVPAPTRVADPNLKLAGELQLPPPPAPSGPANNPPAPNLNPPPLNLNPPAPVAAPPAAPGGDFNLPPITVGAAPAAGPAVPKIADLAVPPLVNVGAAPPAADKPKDLPPPLPKVDPPKLDTPPAAKPDAPPAPFKLDAPPAIKFDEPPAAKPIGLPAMTLPDLGAKPAPAPLGPPDLGAKPANEMPALPPVAAKPIAETKPSIALDPAPPRASAPAPVAKAPEAPSTDVQTDFDVDLHDVRAGESYANISKVHFGDDRYAEALRAFNRGAAPDQVRQVQVPPIHVLRKQYSQLVGRAAQDTGVRPAEWTAAPAGRNTNTQPAAGKSYDVPPGGITLKGIAKLAYGDESQWVKLWDLNPKLKPDEVLPDGTRVNVPADAKLGR